MSLAFVRDSSLHSTSLVLTRFLQILTLALTRKILHYSSSAQGLSARWTYPGLTGKTGFRLHHQGEQYWDQSAVTRTHAVVSSVSYRKRIMDWSVAVGQGGQLVACKLHSTLPSPSPPQTTPWLSCAAPKINTVGTGCKGIPAPRHLYRLGTTELED